MRITKATNIDSIKHLALEWKDACNADSFGIAINPDLYFEKLSRLIERDDAELFLLLDTRDKVIGYMGVGVIESPLADQKIASEHHWYVSGKNQGKGSMLLVRAVRSWAKEKGCSHLIMNASTLASDMHDKVCRFYERLNMKKFETSYIEEIK